MIFVQVTTTSSRNTTGEFICRITRKSKIVIVTVKACQFALCKTTWYLLLKATNASGSLAASSCAAVGRGKSNGFALCLHTRRATQMQT